MKYKPAQLIAYWLGMLPAADQEQLEEAYFSDDDFYGALLDAKDQLIRHYLEKKLTGAEQLRFEQFFLMQPGRRAEVAIMRCALNQKTEPVSVKSFSFLDWWQPTLNWQAEWGMVRVFALGAVLLLGLSVVSWYRWQASQNTIEMANEGNSKASVITLRLSPQLRATEAAQNSLPKHAQLQTLNLELEVEKNTYPSYCIVLTANHQPEVVLAKPCGLSIQTLNDRDIVSAQIAAQNLTAAEYEATLFGMKADQTQVALRRYPFTVR